MRIIFLILISILVSLQANSASKQRDKLAPIKVFKKTEKNSYNAGDLMVGLSAELQFGWYNPGTTPSLVYDMGSGSWNGGSAFSIISNSCSGAHLSAGEVCWVKVKFEPLSEGFFRGKFTISYSATSDYGSSSGVVSHSAYGRGLVPPPETSANPDPQSKQACFSGSIVRIEAQSLGEYVPVVGTDFSLFYSSQFAQDYISDSNTVNRRNYFAPEGWTVSVHKYYDIQKQN